MSNQDTLFPTVKDDIAFDTLLTQAKAVIEQQSGQLWSDTGESDPGMTLLEACCYGASDLAYRLSLPLTDLLTPEQTAGDGIFPQEFGPQQMLTCGPITVEDYRRALLDLHSSDNINDNSEGYFFFNNVQLIREPESQRYQYWYNKEKREYSFKNSGSDSQLTLKGNYWLYLLPSRETETDKTQAQTRLKNFLKNNRNLGESVSKIIWLNPTDLSLQIAIELDDDVKDIADIFAQVYMTAEQMVIATPLRYTTHSMMEQGYNNEEIFSGPYLHHGWIPQLPQTKDYTDSTELNLSHLVNRLLDIKGIQRITDLSLGEHDGNISPLPSDEWSWTISQGYYPRLWGNDPLTIITSPNSPLKITAKGGVKVTVSKQDVENKIITEPLINTQPELLNWGKHRKVLNYYPVSNKLPACYGLQTCPNIPSQQLKLHQFILPFEQMLANSCDELNLLPKLLAFKQRGNSVYGAQWPFKPNTVSDQVYQDIKSTLMEKLNNDSQIYNNDGIHQQNYIKELAILDYLLGYFGTHRAARPLTPDSLLGLKDFLSTQQGYLAQQPELTYHRNNIRIDKVSTLQKRIAARLGLGGECFRETPDLANLPFYLIEHRQLLPEKPDPAFNSEQTPSKVEIKDAPDTKSHLLMITKQGTEGQLLQGQLINLIIIEGDREFTLRGQVITDVDVAGETFSLNTRNSTALEYNLKRVKQAFNDGKLRWQNSPVWMEDMDYQLVYADKTPQHNAEDERWITFSPQSSFPAMIKINDEITLKYVITPDDGPIQTSDYELKAHVIEFDRIQGTILLKQIPDPQNPHNIFPPKEEAWRYRWYFSSDEYAKTDRFSFVVSVVINYQFIENNDVEPYKLESWIKSEILAEFPAHLAMIIHWLPQEHFRNFASTYKRWQKNDAPLGDESYHILEMLTLGRLPSGLTGTGHMRIATPEQRDAVIGKSGTEWNTEVIISNQLLYVPPYMVEEKPK